ncbi:MAG: SEC-C domain-containing protein, partial [Magnetococcus sp. XQGC-1]
MGRNDPCPCGSGKKYKQCHLEQEGGAAWKLAAPTPTIRAMAVAKLVHELPLARLDLIPVALASPVALTEMASVYQANGRLEDALALVKRVLDGDRKDSFLLYDYWIARYAEWLVEAGREKEGEQFLMNEYDKPRQVKQWQVAQKLAAFYIDQGDMENAATWVDTALGGDAKNPFNHYLKGM